MAGEGWLTPCYISVFVLLVVISPNFTLALSNATSCTDVKLLYKSMGLPEVDNDVPPWLIEGENLRICKTRKTCCTESMEKKLSHYCSKEFSSLLEDSLSLVRNQFIKQTRKFDLFFRTLLKNSRQELHEMFQKTYGILYEQNSEVFSMLFDDLDSYYNGSDLNLIDVMDTFFSNLYQRIFILLNAPYHFDERYLVCVSEYLDELQPFGDVPQTLSLQVKRSFVAARTFVQAIIIGRDVINAVADIEPSPECQQALMKMSYCPSCHGIMQVKPCNNYCLNIMKGCLAYHAELNTEWNNYIEKLQLLGDRLRRSFNIQSVVEPINLKISNAIMNFQDNGAQVSGKVFSGCGQPRLSSHKQKREAASEPVADPVADKELEYKTLRFQNKGNGYKGDASSTLEQLVVDISNKVKATENFWHNLPYTMCNKEDLAATATNEVNCWNGNQVSRYLPDVVGNGLGSQNSNPEVEVDIKRVNSVVNQQILQLKLASSKLSNAYNGVDVDWVDQDGMFHGNGYQADHGSGSGSGYGSGDEYGVESGDGIDPYAVDRYDDNNIGGDKDDLHFYSQPPSTPKNNNRNRHNKPSKACSNDISSIAVGVSLILWLIIRHHL